MKTYLCCQLPCLFLDKGKRWNIKMEQANTVRCWPLTIIDIDHAEKALIIILQPMHLRFIFLSIGSSLRDCDNDILKTQALMEKRFTNYVQPP